MQKDDFRYMWRGISLQTLDNEHLQLLAPIDIRRAGKKRALLLLHGFSSSPAVYREIIPALTMYDAIICPALPGHAYSLHAFATVKANDWLLAVENTCATLLHDYQEVDVLGFSLGGLLACHLSERFPIHHLYLLAPALSLKMKLTATLKFARFMQKVGFKSVYNRSGNFHTKHASELAYRQLPLTAIIEVLTLINTFQFKAPQCPVDLFLGSFDEVVSSLAVAERFANLTNVTTHWLTNSAHMLPLDGDIEAIIACMRANE